MPRPKKNLGDLADSVLAEVDREQVVKTAALAHISSAPMKTPLGQLLMKTAALVREAAADTEISYDDLSRFRKTYDL